MTDIPRLPLLAVAGLGLALAAACGGDDSTSNTPTGSGSSTATSPASIGASASPGGSSGTPQASGSGSGTPGPTAQACANATPDAGLISQVVFGPENGPYLVGQPIDITLLLANCGDNDAVLHFPTSQRYDFVVADANGVEVWGSADGKSYEQVEGTETLAPGLEQRYTETWDQKDRSGNQVALGRYKVSAFSVGCSIEPRADCKFGPVGFIEIVVTLSSAPAT